MDAVTFNIYVQVYLYTCIYVARLFCQTTELRGAKYTLAVCRELYKS